MIVSDEDYKRSEVYAEKQDFFLGARALLHRSVDEGKSVEQALKELWLFFIQANGNDDGFNTDWNEALRSPLHGRC